MEPLAQTVIEDTRWQDLQLDQLADRAALALLTELAIAPEGLCFCVMGCDDARIAELNSSFRGQAKPTNVLSWPSEERAQGVDGQTPEPPEAGDPEDPESLGDIALAFETCHAEALVAQKPVEDHVTHLIIHGLLHLLGYDHVRDADADLMESIEVRTLANLGLSDPYSV
jgi:probable rRNA maturation factor